MTPTISKTVPGLELDVDQAGDVVRVLIPGYILEERFHARPTEHGWLTAYRQNSVEIDAAAGRRAQNTAGPGPAMLRDADFT